jgi:hypothetical protein
VIETSVVVVDDDLVLWKPQKFDGGAAASFLPKRAIAPSFFKFINLTSHNTTNPYKINAKLANLRAKPLPERLEKDLELQ